PNTPNIVNTNLYNTQIGTTTAMITGTYTYRWTIANGVCSDSWDEVTIDVLTDFSAGNITGGSGTIPFGGDPDEMTANPSGGAGTYTYQWYYLEGTDCPETGGATLIGGATNQNYDPPSGLTATTSYQCQVNPAGSPDCGGATWTNNCITVTVGDPLFGLYVQGNYLYNSTGSYIYVD
ncbi:MAG: hypothetical protein KJ607_07640, partial [Bacteroidetes bacterium]|nr:hypothetical protein [Bacteroidota bacterium]